MKKTLFLAMLLAAAGGASAQPGPGATGEGLEQLSLRECLETGLERNYDIRIVRNDERISDNDATAANAGMVPTIDLEAGYAGTFDNSRETALRAGGSESEQSVYDQAADVGVAVNWTLFDGFRIRTEYKKLKELQQKGALQTRLTIEDFVATFTAEYYNFVQQTLRLANFRYSMDLSRERMRIAEEWYHVGSSAQLDVLQARVDFNADSSQYMSQQELVTASRIRINELLANADLGREFTVQDTLIVINDRLRWEDLVSKTCETNAELLIADRDNAISELELKSIRSRNYPYVRLSTGYGYNYNRYGSGTNLSRGTVGLNAGVQIGFTLFDGNRRREQRNARIAVENTQLTRQQLEQSILASLANFWQAYRNNLEVIQLEKENLIAARENYRIAMDLYAFAQLPGIEVREAQKSLLDAQERILTAQYNTKLCEISLQQISGNVLIYMD